MVVGFSFGNDAQSAALSGFFNQGWEQVGFLGIGARGSVLRIRRSVGGEETALKRATSEEVRALQVLSGCRNVIGLLEHFKGDGPDEVWARLELLEGDSLRSYLRSMKGEVPQATVRYILQGVLSGLQDIHQRGWMHRDVKAENIGFTSMLGCESCPKLMDFDTAVAVPRGTTLYEVIGTVENMAPEVFAGRYNESADCWSLGVVAYEMLFGYRPFNDACIEQVEEMVRSWEKYLLLPSDAAEAPSSFIRELLTDRKDRMSSQAAGRHHWLLSGSSPPRLTPSRRNSMPDSTPSQMNATSAECHTPTASQGAGDLSPEHQRWCSGRRRTLGSTDLSDAAALFNASGSSGLGSTQDTSESLARLRRSLSEWNKSNYGPTKTEMNRQPPIKAAELPSSQLPALSRNRRVSKTSVTDSAAGAEFEEVRRRVKQQLEAANAVLQAAESKVAEAWLQQAEPEAEASPKTKNPRAMHPAVRRASDAATALDKSSGGGSSSSSSARSLREDVGKSSPNQPDADAFHKDYLERMRQRTQEMVKDAESHVSQWATNLADPQMKDQECRTQALSKGRALKVARRGSRSAEVPPPVPWSDSDAEKQASAETSQRPPAPKMDSHSQAHLPLTDPPARSPARRSPPPAPLPTDSAVEPPTDDLSLQDQLLGLQQVSSLHLRQLQREVQQQYLTAGRVTQCRTSDSNHEVTPPRHTENSPNSVVAGGAMCDVDEKEHEEVVAHLRGVRRKTQELLLQLSKGAAASCGGSPLDRSRSCGPASDLEASPSAAGFGSPKSYAGHHAQQTETTEVSQDLPASNSPRSWLASQRRRTQDLLHQLKTASETVVREPHQSNANLPARRSQDVPEVESLPPSPMSPLCLQEFLEDEVLSSQCLPPACGPSMGPRASPPGVRSLLPLCLLPKGSLAATFRWWAAATLALSSKRLQTVPENSGTSSNGAERPVCVWV